MKKFNIDDMNKKLEEINKALARQLEELKKKREEQDKLLADELRRTNEFRKLYIG